MAIVVETLEGGGAERVALDLAAHWPRDHADPLLVVGRLSGAYVDRIPHGIDVVEIGLTSNPRNTVPFARRLGKLISDHGVIGIISHMTAMNRMVLRCTALRNIRVPVVVVEHNNFVMTCDVLGMNWWRWFLLRAEIRVLYRRAHAVIGVSKGVARQIGRLFGISPNRLGAIENPLGIAGTWPSGMGLDLFATMPRPVYLSVGRLVRQKNFEDLIEAFSMLGSGSLVLLGEGPERDRLEGFAAARGVSERVHFPGFVKDPGPVYRAADVFVLPSRWEGYPLVLLEAYGAGLPVVARDFDFGAREIVTAGRPGRLVRSQRVEALARAMAEVAGEERPSGPVDLSANDPAKVAGVYADLLLDGCVPSVEAERKRVVMLAPQLGYGGAESSFLRLARMLSDRFDVRIALFRRDYGNSGYSTQIADVGVPVIVLDDGDGRGGPVARWARRYKNFGILKRDSDLAISFLSGPNLLNALCVPERPSIVSERGSKASDTGMSRWTRFLWTRLLDPFTYTRASVVVTASKGLASEVAESAAWFRTPPVAIEGTVDADHLLEQAEAPVEENFLAYDRYKTIVAFGRMHRQKGFDFIIRAFMRIRDAEPCARLLLIGDGPDLAEYLDLTVGLGLRAGQVGDPEAEDVTFAGHRSDPVRYLRLGHVFVLPSRYEGLPNALIEAVAAGVPILASDCRWGPRSVLSRRGDDSADYPVALDYGSILPRVDDPGGLDLWTDALGQAIRYRKPRAGLEARRAAIARFDLRETGKAWIELIEAMTGPRPSSETLSPSPGKRRDHLGIRT